MKTNCPRWLYLKLYIYNPSSIGISFKIKIMSMVIFYFIPRMGCHADMGRQMEEHLASA
jgi:hypothetical protein